jgi:predicted GNAT family acetyltransferase
MTGMGWQTTGDVAEFLAAAGPYLRRERARNTVILTVTETMRVNASQTHAVRERVSYGGITVWEAAGEPVAIAGATRQVAGMGRIGPVYTPPEFRGRGYGSAATAAASQGLLAAGAEDVLLYTDLANPVSNSIYQRIGYRAVEDRVVLEFTAA